MFLIEKYIASHNFTTLVLKYTKIKLTEIFKNCTELPEVANSISSCINGFERGSTCFYICDPGHQLVGETFIGCQNNGEWSHPVPECLRQLKCTFCFNFSVNSFSIFLCNVKPCFFKNFTVTKKIKK